MRCLFVKPAPSRDASGGDTIVYRRLAAYLAERTDMRLLELTPIPRLAQLYHVARATPPEATRYISRRNRRALRQALEGGDYDVVLFGHESTFPLSDEPAIASARKLFFAHNVHSLIAKTDRSLVARLTGAAARTFEKRWYADPSAELICISQADVRGLAEHGLGKAPAAVVPPGAPPPVALRADARVFPEAVLTGSYGWWRKRRDLKRFAAEPPLPTPIRVADPLAEEILSRRDTPLAMGDLDWGAGLRFGLITDRFQGGFKLKSLEYVANNCMVLSLCDLSAEFEGLPHAEEFVRWVSGKAEMGDVIAKTLAQPQAELLARFAVFKAACMARYDWSQALAPLGGLLAR